MQTTAEIEAAKARKSDAEVSFKTSVFIEETLVNLFGMYALPYVLWKHGRIGAYNRMMTGFNEVRRFWPVSEPSSDTCHTRGCSAQGRCGLRNSVTRGL